MNSLQLVVGHSRQHKATRTLGEQTCQPVSGSVRDQNPIEFHAEMEVSADGDDRATDPGEGPHDRFANQRNRTGYEGKHSPEACNEKSCQGATSDLVFHAAPLFCSPLFHSCLFISMKA